MKHTLSMIRKVMIFLLYLGSEVGGDHLEAIKTVNELPQQLSGVSISTSDAACFVGDDISEHCRKHRRRRSVLTHMASKVPPKVKS